jgi:hypothetical protein
MTGGCSLKNVADSAGGAFAKNKLFIGNPSNNGGIEEGEIVDHGRLHLAQRLRTQASSAIYRRRVDCSHATFALSQTATDAYGPDPFFGRQITFPLSHGVQSSAFASHSCSQSKHDRLPHIGARACYVSQSSSPQPPSPHVNIFIISFVFPIDCHCLHPL